MSQILHIFRKDLRRLQIEIWTSILALAAVTWTEWWLATPARDPRWYNQAAPVVVLFFSWWFLIVRLIHGEALSGDRQFWITRPYVWHKLLVAKVLFILTCVGVPFVASQIILLLVDGASIGSLLSRILLGAGSMMLIGIVPVWALAVITRNLPQWLIGLALGILLMIGMAWLDSELPNAHVSTGTDISDTLQLGAFISLTALAILIGYARRDRFRGALAIAAAVVAIPLIMVATPYRAIIERQFSPVTSEQMPFQVTFSSERKPATGFIDTGSDRKVKLAIPIKIFGMPNNMLLRLDGVMLSIDLPDGRHWNSEWQPAYQDVLVESKDLWLGMEVDQKIYERVESLRTPARLSIAFSELEDKDRQRIMLHQGFELPGVGHCWIDRDGRTIVCRSTENGPPLVLVTDDDASSCDSKPTGQAKKIRTLHSNSPSGPLSPLSLYIFYPWTYPDVDLVRERLCPGIGLTFSTPQLARRFRLELPVEQLQLNRYVTRLPGS
jgi:hypothetical protein